MQERWLQQNFAGFSACRQFNYTVVINRSCKSTFHCRHSKAGQAFLTHCRSQNIFNSGQCDERSFCLSNGNRKRAEDTYHNDNVWKQCVDFQSVFSKSNGDSLFCPRFATCIVFRCSSSFNSISTEFLRGRLYPWNSHQFPF